MMFWVLNFFSLIVCFLLDSISFESIYSYLLMYFTYVSFAMAVVFYPFLFAVTPLSIVLSFRFVHECNVINETFMNICHLWKCSL